MFTRDRADSEALRFHTVESLGEKRGFTNEGYLVCYDVPLARTGTMLYGPGETPIQAVDGRVRITRDESEVFRPEFIASLNGKPVVNDHPDSPDGDVNVDNWHDYVVGTVMNVRRGTGLQGDMLIGDLVITDKTAIEDIQAGKREVSAGYDSKYEQTGPGEGRQYNMLGNHIALVDSGRCGARCAIGDAKTIGDNEMANGKNGWLDSVVERFRKAAKARDAEAMEEVTKEAKDAMAGGEGEGEGSGEVHIHMPGVKDEDFQAHVEKNDMEHKAFDERISALEGKLSSLGGAGENDPDKAATGDGDMPAALAEEAPTGTGDKARKARDSEFLEASFQQTLADCEILAPGLQFPTFDRAAQPGKTYDGICKLRRRALETAACTAEGSVLVKTANGGKDLALDAMPCRAVTMLFRTAVAAQRATNNARQAMVADAHRQQQAARGGGGNEAPGSPRTLAELNKRNAEHYSAK